jgi:ABC-type multidrug transport system fused ATPase/permease subunit
MSQILVELIKLANLIVTVTKGIASAKRIDAVMTLAPSMSFPNETAVPSEKSDVPAVIFDKVSLTYKNAGDASISNISFSALPGETIGIVGGTGSGKSSIINLIPRFYDATGGDVLVGGMSVKEYKLSDLRKKIGFVMQRSELFSGSIKDNVIWGKDGASDEEIDGALKVASADSFVFALADGKNSSVAEKGTSLSGGQKQRLSIARAVLRKPDILILDDSTSALDLSTEANVRAAIREKMSGTTVIMIAQRIASVKDADRIAVIENGCISACGTHDELMATSEAYRDIYASQMRAGGAGNE